MLNLSLSECPDFKSNEYANLLGGKIFEPKEENPMLGFRGAARYISESLENALNWNVWLLRESEMIWV